MAKQTVSRTALGTAICRLIEQYQPERTRLFYDPVIRELIGAPIRLMMRFAGMRNLTMKQTESVAEGIYGAQVCRTRYIDDAVRIALSGGIRQLVILGAGFDTRPYRLPGIESAKVFEIDLPSVQSEKEKKIQKYLGQVPDHVTFIPMDFDMQTLEAILPGTLFDQSKLTMFIWEGVTQYIPEDAVRNTLAFVGKSTPGSSIAFTYVLRSIIERRSDIPDADQMMDVVAKQSPWIFGLDSSAIDDFLKPYHLSLVEDIGEPDYRERYLEPLGRSLAVFKGERIVHAIVH